ncbi:MAG TPA: Mpo1-like protein [Usitatibacter sp.]|nr:Mpo1-like protein [Usitatibacter sp.]
MNPVEQSLTQYAAYHRDRRNIATHFVGVPMIVFAIILALATLAFPFAGITLTAATVVAVLMSGYYLMLDRVLGVAMAIALFLLCAAASEVSARFSTGGTLGIAFVVFTVGWAIQFLGHKYEGMKPAFFDDARQLLIGPLFVCAEAFFLLGGRPALRRYIEQRVGPTLARRDGAPLTPAT